jgi:hypothetical protein
LLGVGYYTIVGMFKDGRWRIRINGNHQVCLLNTNHKMKGAAGTTDDGRFGTADDAGLADLPVTTYVAFVNRWPGCSNLAVQKLGQLAQHIEVTVHPTAADDQGWRR